LETLVSAGIPDPAFWRGKRVFLTGHSGFKGAWLTIWLHSLGAEVLGVSLQPATRPSLFESANVAGLCRSVFSDVRDAAAMRDIVAGFQPHVALHLAAQALVRRSYREPLSTFAVNVIGTANVLEALRDGGTRVAVVVTTDKVYANDEQAFPFRETDPLGGHDPYSASKAACEIVVASYRESFLRAQGTALASARAGNVIGGGDWAEDRLIPDAIRAWESGVALQIRRPDSVRPWQHVIEPLSAYLLLAERLWAKPSLADAYNFGPRTHEAATVRQVIEIAQRTFGDKASVQFQDGTVGPHESGWLSLETARAQRLLGVVPRWALEESVVRTIDWYRRRADGADARKLCLDDLGAFARRA
jgi:CDP-glucose 4,6-dehydratase